MSPQKLSTFLAYFKDTLAGKHGKMKQVLWVMVIAGIPKVIVDYNNSVPKATFYSDVAIILIGTLGLLMRSLLIILKTRR